MTIKDPRVACQGKFGHKSFADAMRALPKTRGTEPGRGKISAYRCSHCGKYHLGSGGK